MLLSLLIWVKRHLKQDNPCVLEGKLRQGVILYGTVNLNTRPDRYRCLIIDQAPFISGFPPNTIKEEVVVFELAKITGLFLVGLS